MKKSPLPALCAAAVTILLLPACAETEAPSPDTAPQASAPSLPDSDREEYLSRIAELNSTVLTLKEERFITKAEYEARIKALMTEIAALESRLALLDATNGREDLPVGGAPSDPAETTPQKDPPAAMAFHYEIRDGRAVILAYQGNETRVVIPAAIEGYPVTSIGDNAFKAAAVVSVEIPYSVTDIGWFAFSDCTTLTDLTLPASVESIGYGAFDGCPSLTVYCPENSYAAAYATSFALRHELT